MHTYMSKECRFVADSLWKSNNRRVLDSKIDKRIRIIFVTSDFEWLSREEEEYFVLLTQ